MINKEPPENGEIVIRVDKQPVSVNSKKGNRKKQLIKFIRNIISEAEYFLSGDVKVEIDWFVSEQMRYESISIHDVDNIISPVIDAISGMKGIVIDDNQVQSISCSWIDINSNETEHFIIKIKFIPVEYMEKIGLFYVEFNKGFCFPLWENYPIQLQRKCVEMYEKMLKYRYELENRRFPYPKAKLIMPTRRVFHRSRLNGFKIIGVEDLKKILN